MSYIGFAQQEGPNLEKMFERFDTDGNGSISLEEFKSAKRKNDVPVERLEKNFARLDSDSNDAITLKELKDNWGNNKKEGKGRKKD